ncbi:MAG: hypothetical protein QMB59_07945, partial [Bacteroidales bacterium]
YRVRLEERFSIYFLIHFSFLHYWCLTTFIIGTEAGLEAESAPNFMAVESLLEESVSVAAAAALIFALK